MKIPTIFIILFCNAFVGYSFHYAPTDSVGSRSIDGRRYVVHQVEAGETLFALSRKYNVTIQEIKDANSEALNSLRIGQTILVPGHQHTKTLAANGKTHTVQASETLFSVAQRYGLTVDELKQWNSISGNTIAVGQVLIVGKDDSSLASSAVNGDKRRRMHTVMQSETLYSISRQYGVSTDQLMEWNKLVDSSLKIGQVLVVGMEVSEEAVEPGNTSMLPTTAAAGEVLSDEPETSSESAAEPQAEVVEAAEQVNTTAEGLSEGISPPTQKVVQNGLAEVIDDTQNTKKYLALHREAPVGTIMQVKNEMNNQTVFVRVVGPIQPTGDNGKVILKLSRKAFDRLGAVDDRFPVELSYIP
jgi:LysM repeat protein